MNLWWLEQKHFEESPLHNKQYAFRPGRSCDHALADIIDFVEGGKKEGHVTAALFLDIKGAFDHLKPEAAIKAMRERGITPWFIDWYGYAYLLNRKVKTTLHGKTLRRWLKRGSPQGGVFSPILWNIVFDELLKIVNSGPFIPDGQQKFRLV
jgi:retron-type reverse transcriptase